MKTQREMKKALQHAYAGAVGRLFDRAFKEVSDPNDTLPLDIQKKLALYHVKYMPAMNKNKELTYEQLLNKFRAFDLIHFYLAQFTPREFMQYFPIKKDYDGKRYESKDYFTTMEYLKTLNWDEPIDLERIDDFLWEYTNLDLMNFEVDRMSTASDLRVAQGGRDIMQEWMDDKGIPTYSLHTDDTGKQFMQNSQTGEVAEVKEYKRRPKWIRAVK
ncbi:MAG: hypothetical protein ACE3JK_14075 [Sporolactobacillus sp.]